MNRIGLIAVVAFSAAALPVSAQTMHRETRTTTIHHDNGYHGPVVVKHRKRKVCSTRWVNHHKVNHCTWR